MKSIVSLLVSLVIVCGCAKENPKPPSDPTAVAAASSKLAIPRFDGSAAFAYLTAQTDFGPRNPGSAAHRNCMNYLYAELGKYADAVNLQPFSAKGYTGAQVPMWNIIASFRPAATTRILLVAHWDSRPWADQETDTAKAKKPILGANDGASGVAVLLEIARLLKSAPADVGVDMLLTDGEDYAREGKESEYLRGSKYFAANLPPGFLPAYGILLDMVGDKNLELLKERYSVMYAPDIVEKVWGAARTLGVAQFSDREQNYVTDDHLPLNKAGIKTVDLIDFDYPDESNSYWHTLKDTPDKCSAESLEAVGKVLVYLIYTEGR